MRLLCVFLLGCAAARADLPDDAPIVTSTDQALSAKRGLLADGQPVKGLYFFAGERSPNYALYTAHARDERNYRWNSDPSTRAFVLDQIEATHVNTLMMSAWSIMPYWSPMAIDEHTLPGLVETVRGRALKIIPALESGEDKAHPEVPQWNFADDFPSPATGFTTRIEEMLALFKDDMSSWAQLYDRNGDLRYALHILHVCSARKTNDAEFAAAFDRVAEDIERRYGVKVGFTLDTMPTEGYTPYPNKTFERSASILAIQGYAGEINSNLAVKGDNNWGNLDALLDWKRQALDDWIATGVPVIADVSSGFDGRFVWGGKRFWGDNLDYTYDRWRNGMSQLKGGGIVGMTFNTWNGYTEGYAAVPSIEHGTTISDWLRDLYSVDPRLCHHVHYENGKPSFTTYGAICEAWVGSGGERGYFGAPISDEMDWNGERLSVFEHGRITFADGRIMMIGE